MQNEIQNLELENNLEKAEKNKETSLLINNKSFKEENNNLKEEYLFNLESLINDLLKTIKSENFSHKEKIAKISLEKTDLINQIKKQEEIEANLKLKISEFSVENKSHKSNIENLQSKIKALSEKENDTNKIINTKDNLLENLTQEVKKLQKSLTEKDNLILQKANEVNSLLQIRAINEEKILSLYRQNEEKQSQIRQAQLQNDLSQSENNLKAQLKENQILNLDNQITQLTNEINSNREIYIEELQKCEEKINNLTIDKHCNQQKLEFNNEKIIQLNKTNLQKENQIENLNSEIKENEKQIKKITQEIILQKEITFSRDQEISEIYKFKEKYDRYIYFEKTLENSENFSLHNLSDMKIFEENFLKIIAIKKENEKQLENLKNLNIQLTNESKEFVDLKVKYEKMEREFLEVNDEVVKLRMKNFDDKKLIEDFKGENLLLSSLNERIIRQNKVLLKEEKISRTNFTIFNSAIDTTKQDYEEFIYKNIEDMEGINSSLNYENIKLSKNLKILEAEKFNYENIIQEKDRYIKEINSYCENLEENLTQINTHLKSEKYQNSIGLDLITKGRQEFYENNQISELNNKLKHCNDTIISLKSTEEYLTNQIEFYQKNLKEKDNENSLQKTEIIKLKKAKNEIFAEVNTQKSQKNKLESDVIYLQNNTMIKDNFINSIKLENSELRKKMEENRLTNELIQSEISNNSKESIEKLNENMQLLLNKMENIFQENSELRNLLNSFGKKIIENNLIDKDNDNKVFNKEIFYENCQENFDFENAANLILLLPINERNVLTCDIPGEDIGNLGEENVNKIKRKFYLVQKMLILADKEIEKGKDNKLKNDNLLTIISNLESQNKVLKSRIIHIENILRSKEINISLNEINTNTTLSNYSNINVNHKSTFINNSEIFFEDNNNNISNSNINSNISINFLTIQNLKKDIDNLNLINLDLRGKNEALTNKNKNLLDLISGEDINSINNFKTFSSKFFSEKYNEIINEKNAIEQKLNNFSINNENLIKEKNEQTSQIRNLQISKANLELLLTEMEKKSNESNTKIQENFGKEISELKLNNQNYLKEKNNLQSTLMKLKSEKNNSEITNKNNLSEIEKLKEILKSKDEEIISLKEQVNKLNIKNLSQSEQIKKCEIEIESLNLNKNKNEGNKNNNNIWVKKLCGIMGKARSIIEIFIQLKKNFEEKIKNYEEIIYGKSLLNAEVKGMNNIKPGDIVNLNNNFVTSMTEMNLKMSKYEQEGKLYRKKEENLEKKISNLTFELNLYQDKEKKMINELKEFKESKTGLNLNEEKEAAPPGASQNIKTYFSKMIKNLLTAQNLISFKENVIKKLEGDIVVLNNKLNEAEKNNLKESQNENSKSAMIILQNKKLIEVNCNLTKTINELAEEKSELFKNLGNKTIENITINKDMNSMLKYYNDQNQNIISDNFQNNQEVNSNNKTDQSNSNLNVNNLNQQIINKTKDFSHLFILMRKATKLFSSFDNKVKNFTDKINMEK